MTTQSPTDDEASQPASAARQALLDKAIGHIAVHGMSDLSLRELAAAIGTSHRMLNYHFGGRDGLVAAIVESIEAQQRTALAELADGSRSPREVIEAQWGQLTDPAIRPYVALFFEVLALAFRERPGTDGFLHDLTDPWLDLAQRIADEHDWPTDRDDLRLGVAVSRGLLIEVLASDDIEAPTRSLTRFLDLWEGSVT